jgi:hypothetical protein
MSTVIELTVADHEREDIAMLTSLIRAWVRSAYGRGAHDTAWLYAPCLVGIRLIKRSLGSFLLCETSALFQQVEPFHAESLQQATMFHHANHIDANQSHFSNVGHDQHNVGRDQLIQTINVNIPGTAPQETVQHILGTICHIPKQLPPSSSNAIIGSHHNRSACDVASNLIVEIKRLLADLAKFSVD